MKIIAKSGPDRYLVDLQTEVDGVQQGQVVDRGRVFPQHSLMSLVARGYWDPVDYDEAETNEILTGLTSP